MNGWRESARLTRDLHLLLEAGMPVPEALARIQKKSTGRWAVAIRKAKEAAASGSNLAQALRHTGSFPRLLVDSLEAADDELPLLRLSELLEKTDWRQRQTATILAYPVILLVSALALMAFLCSTIGLSFTALFADMSIKLPVPTQLTLAFVRLVNQPLVIAGVLAALGLLGWVLAGTATSAPWRLRLPLIGSWIRRSQAATWLDWVDYYLDSDRPAPEAMRRAALACSDPAFRAQAEAAAAAAERGQDLHTALSRQGMLSELGLWLVARGETLEFPPHYLRRVAALLHRELESESEGGLACLEVAGILLIAVVVFPMILSFFLPLYQTIGNL